jgi:hypothetical protein
MFATTPALAAVRNDQGVDDGRKSSVARGLMPGLVLGWLESARGVFLWTLDVDWTARSFQGVDPPAGEAIEAKKRKKYSGTNAKSAGEVPAGGQAPLPLPAPLHARSAAPHSALRQARLQVASRHGVPSHGACAPNGVPHS